MLYDAKGLTIADLKPVDAKNFKATIHIASDARLGEYPLRIAHHVRHQRDLQRSGSARFRRRRKSSRTTTSTSREPIAAMNVTVEGIMKDEDVDYFAVDAKKGQRLTVEVEGMRLGNAFFDPFVAILNKDRFEVASNDDSSLLVQDPIVSIDHSGRRAIHDSAARQRVRRREQLVVPAARRHVRPAARRIAAGTADAGRPRTSR